jgi:hypothetical protein
MDSVALRQGYLVFPGFIPANELSSAHTRGPCNYAKRSPTNTPKRKGPKFVIALEVIARGGKFHLSTNVQVK